MSHLHSERLVALADEIPTAAEAAHLAACQECARERAAFRALGALAKTAPATIGPPLTQWESLASALHEEGLIRHGRRGRASSGRRHAWLQAAAAVAFVAVGVAAGRYTAGATVLPMGTRAAVAVADSGTSANQPQPFHTVAEAQQAEGQSQATYQAAMAFLAQHDTSGRSGDSPASMRARLAALDQVRATMDLAMHEAPYDPVINGYYLSSIGQRAATLRQLNAASIRLTSY